MPAQLIPILIAVGVTAASAVAVWYLWPQMEKKFSGKQLLLIGQRASGKTTMAHLLRHDELPERTHPTESPHKYPATNLDFNDLNLKVSALDMPGQEEAKEAKWKDAFEMADFTFYLVRADLFLKGNEGHIARVERDMRSIKKWLKDRKKTVVIVATHEDCVDGYSNVSDALKCLEAYKKAVSLLNPESRRGPVVGSLVTREAGKDLIFRALKEALPK